MDGRRLWAARGESAVLWDVDTMMPDGNFRAHPPDRLGRGCRKGWKRGESYRPLLLTLNDMRDNGSVNVLATSLDGELVATTRADETVRVWRIGSPHPIVSVQRPMDITSSDSVNAVFGQAGRYVAVVWRGWESKKTAKYEPSIRIFQLPGGAEVAHGTLASDASQAEFSPDESLLSVVSGQTLKVFELPSLRERWALPDIREATFSQDGRFLGTVDSKDGTVVIREAATKRPVGQPAVHDQALAKLAFSRDGELFATGTEGGQVILRQTRTGKEIARLVHVAAISDLAFAADGSVLASTSEDGSTRVMDCRTGVEVARLTHSSPPVRIRFSADGKYLTTETDDGLQVWLWRGRDIVDEACRRVQHDLSADEWRLYLGEQSPTACRAQARAAPR